MKVLARVEIHCRDHDCFKADCQLCRLLKRTENSLQALRASRACLLQEIKRHLTSRALTIIDLR
jgi:hypothetical protein